MCQNPQLCQKRNITKTNTDFETIIPFNEDDSHLHHVRYVTHIRDHIKVYKGIMTLTHNLAVEKQCHPTKTTTIFQAFTLVYGQLPVREQLLNLFEGHHAAACVARIPHGNAMVFEGQKKVCKMWGLFWTNIFCKQNAPKNCGSSHSVTGQLIWSNLSWPGEVQLNPGDVLQDGEGKEKHRISQHYGPYTPEN